MKDFIENLKPQCIGIRLTEVNDCATAQSFHEMNHENPTVSAIVLSWYVGSNVYMKGCVGPGPMLLL